MSLHTMTGGAVIDLNATTYIGATNPNDARIISVIVGGQYCTILGAMGDRADLIKAWKAHKVPHA